MTQKDQTVLSNYIPEQSSRIFIGIQKYPVPKKVKVTVSGTPSRTTRHKKKQKNTTPKEKEKSIKPIQVQMLELAGKKN